MLECPRRARAEHARLHLIGDQRNPEGRCGAAQRLSPARRGRNHPALTEHELGDQRSRCRHATVRTRQRIGRRDGELDALLPAHAERAAILLRVRQKARLWRQHHRLLAQPPTGARRARGPRAAMESALYPNVFAAAGGNLGEHESGLHSAGPAGRAQVDAGIGGKPHRQDRKQLLDEPVAGRRVKVQ